MYQRLVIWGIVGSRKGVVELITVVVGSAVEVKSICEYVSGNFKQKVVWIYSW